MEEKKEPRIVDSGPIVVKVDLKKALETFMKGVIEQRLRDAAAAANEEDKEH